MLRLRNTLGNMHDPDMPAMAVSWRMWDWEAAHMHLRRRQLYHTADPASD